MKRLGCLLLLIIVVGAGILFFGADRWLMLETPQRSEVIVVLAGDYGDVRFRRAVELLRAGYAPRLVLDADSNFRYGRSDFDLAQEFVRQAAPDVADRIRVCRFRSNSTVGELRDVSGCLRETAPAASTALIVTSTFHTRRAVAIARKVLPEYRWSVAGADDPIAFGRPWWSNRQWAKTTLVEWQKVLWWKLVEQWTVRPS